MAKKKKSGSTSGKLFGKIILIAVILVVVGFLVLRLVNSCSDCEKTFFGLGYEGNVIDSVVDEKEQILCEDCAERHHALSLLAGKELDDYKRVLVPGKLIPGEVKFGAKSDG